MLRRAALATAFVIATSLPASAGTIYDFYATSQFPSAAGATDFSLQFDDTSGDGLLQLGEIVPGSFSGVTIGSTFYTTLDCVPQIALVSSSACTIAWGFNNNSQHNFTPTFVWTYAVTPVSAVPLPAPFLLLAAALGALGLGGWWRKRCERVRAA